MSKGSEFARPLGAFISDVKLSHIKHDANKLRAFVRSAEFLQTREWLELRWKILERDGRVCRCCGTRGMPSNPLQVDHMKPRWKFPDLALDPNNLQVLCFQCNNGKGGSFAA